MATILAWERHPVQPGSADDFGTLVEGVLTQIRGQPGALWADAARTQDDDPSFLVLSEWRTEADLNVWEGSDAAAAFRDSCEVLLRESPTRRRFSAHPD